MFKNSGFVLAAALLWGLWGGAVDGAAADPQAPLSPIAQKAKAIVEAAHTFARENAGDMETIRRAFAEDPRFRDDDNELYLFMHAYDAKRQEAVCVAHGIRTELVGKNMWGLRTPNGRLLFQEEVRLMERHEEFWLAYEWLNPYSEKIETKRSFFKKIVLGDGRTAWIGCGFWQK